jgi:hypothetical protein
LSSSLQTYHPPFSIVKEEKQPLKDQENKVCFILYIANKFDILKHGIGDKEQFQEEKRKLKENILKIFKETVSISMILAPIIFI